VIDTRLRVYATTPHVDHMQITLHRSPILGPDSAAVESAGSPTRESVDVLADLAASIESWRTEFFTALPVPAHRQVPELRRLRNYLRVHLGQPRSPAQRRLSV